MWNCSETASTLSSVRANIWQVQIKQVMLRVLFAVKGSQNEFTLLPFSRLLPSSFTLCGVELL